MRCTLKEAWRGAQGSVGGPMVRGEETAARPAHRVSEVQRTSRGGLRWTQSGGRGTESTKRTTADTDSGMKPRT